MSPFQFSLIAEALSKLLHREKEVRLIKGVKIANQTEITHVLFVDYVLMFRTGTISNIQNLEKVLRRYQEAKGMEINLGKSNLLHNNMDEEVITQANTLILITMSTIDKGFKYLGFQLKPNSYSTRDWMWLYKKIKNWISMWTNRFLSKGGRLVLLKAVLQSIPVYWASIAYIPKGILTKVRKNFLSFLWTTRKKRRDPIGEMDKISSPKVNRRLGDEESRALLQSIGS